LRTTPGRSACSGSGFEDPARFAYGIAPLRGPVGALHAGRARGVDREAGARGRVGRRALHEVLLKHGATVDSFDYSAAVEANAANNGGHPKLTLVQADIRRIPFPRESYDLVVCLGVLQHTPDPEESIRRLWEMVKPGGALVIDHYRRKIRNYLPPPIGVAGMVYRWRILRLPADRQFAVVSGSWTSGFH